MQFRISKLLTILIVFTLCVITNAKAQDDIFADKDRTIRSDTQDRIQNIFGNIETVGSAYNSGGNDAAGRAALNAGCQSLVNYILQTRLFAEMKDAVTPDLDLPDAMNTYFASKAGELGNSTINSLCAGETDSMSTVDIPRSLRKSVGRDIIPRLIAMGQQLSNSSGLPFLSRLEIEGGKRDGELFGSITSIQPLWQDELNRHHMFAQLSWYNVEADLNKLGFQKEYSTLNAGLAYRYLTADKNYLYGANIFFDHAPSKNHNRMSVGVDARTSQLAMSANKYFPVSGWKKLNSYYEEKPAGGYDLEIRGQVPQLPSWTASLKGYEWDEQDDGKDMYGIIGAVEYSPVPALAVRLGVRDTSQDEPVLEAALRFNWRFDQPADLQWRERTALAPVSDYVYEKVQRENIIRVKQQRRAESKLTVIETIGANTALQASGSSSLNLGQTLMMPVTVTVANTVGAIARLQFADGSILTLAQNSQAIITPNLITLVFGTMQYVSNGNIENVAVPGGTIVLHGTDIDVVSNGVDSSVRVRDGSVDFTGTVSGSVTLQAEEAAESIAGVVGTLAIGSGGYTSHTDTVSVEIDRIADIQTGPRVTPYPYEAPRLISANMIVGGDIIIGLRFNDDVIVSAGTPRLRFVINGNTRFANYVSGSGTNDLHFSYTNVLADTSATTLTVQELDKNGAAIMGNGKDAVVTIADKTISLSGGGGDVTPPSGYAVAFTTDPITNANKTAAAFDITSAEIGATYNYTITSSGGGIAVNGTGTVLAAIESVTGINVTSLNDGTLTVSLTLTDPSSNTGIATTDTVNKDATPPSGFAAAFTTTPVNTGNQATAAFNITSAEVGTTYNYTISSSGGGTNVTGSGIVAAATQSVTGIDLSGLNDGTLTLSVTLTDTIGNVSSASTGTAPKDIAAPSGHAVAFTTAPINNANKAAAAFSITSAEVGTTYNYTISSSGGGTNVTGSGTVAAATQPVTGINLTGLNDGTLTVSVTLTDAQGNASVAVTDTTAKDVVTPAGYGATFTTSPINNGNVTAAAFNITTAEIGTTYNYSITSSGGGTAVTGSGTITGATESVTGINVSGLNDGTLTVSVTLSDTVGNTGSAATSTVSKDISAPTGYATVFTTDPVNNANKSAVAFNITSAQVGTTYNYTISSSGGGTNVTGSGTVAAVTQSVTGLDVTGLNDGTLTVSVTLTDTAGNTGPAATDTVAKDITTPAGYTVQFDSVPVNLGNVTFVGHRINSAEVGATYNYSITSSGGGTPVTGTGTVSGATEIFTGLDLSGLNDGTLTLSTTLTDAGGNVGTAATTTVIKDTVYPTGYAAVFTTDPINNGNKTAAAFNITGAEVGASYSYTISSSGGGTNVTGSGTIAAATESITGINVSGLGDGTLTVTVYLTDIRGNTGVAATDTVTMDTGAPTGYAAAFTTDPINDSNKTAAAFNITGAEVGASYSYTISSSGGGTNVTGSGTIATATQSFTGLNVTGLNDGTLTVSITLTDTLGNAGAAATDTVVKDILAPTITSVSPPANGTYEP